MLSANDKKVIQDYLDLRGQRFTFAQGTGEVAPGSTRVEVEPEGGDYGSGLIKNVVLAKVGYARGWGWNVEQEFIEKTVELGNSKNEGLKCRFEHPQYGVVTLGTAIGSIKNLRVQDDMAIGDLHVLASANKSPQGALGEYIISLASERPDFCALSVNGAIEDYYYYNQDGNRMYLRKWEDWYAMETMTRDGLIYISLGALDACDMVDEGALTSSGLFAASIGPGKISKLRFSKTSNMKKTRLAFDINAKTEGGSDIRIPTNETSPQVGDEVYVVDADGNETAAPDGEHTISDGPLKGTKITVKEGKIESVSEASTEEVEAGEGSKEEKEKVEAGKGDQNATILALQKRIEELEKRPLTQHTNLGGGDTFNGNGGKGEQVPSYQKIAFEAKPKSGSFNMDFLD